MSAAPGKATHSVDYHQFRVPGVRMRMSKASAQRHARATLRAFPDAGLLPPGKEHSMTTTKIADDFAAARQRELKTDPPGAGVDPIVVLDAAYRQLANEREKAEEDDANQRIAKRLWALEDHIMEMTACSPDGVLVQLRIFAANMRSARIPADQEIVKIEERIAAGIRAIAGKTETAA
jgi:hypothetical protein